MQVYSTLLRLEPSYGGVAADREYISSISGLISKDAIFPTRTSSEEAAAPTETLHRVLSPPDPLVSEAPGGQTILDVSHSQRVLSWHLWFRLYAYATLLESRIFPDMELCDEFLEYTPFGFADIWKGNYHGELVCIKAVRRGNLTYLRETKRVCGLCFILN